MSGRTRLATGVLVSVILAAALTACNDPGDLAIMNEGPEDVTGQHNIAARRRVRRFRGITPQELRSRRQPGDGGLGSLGPGRFHHSAGPVQTPDAMALLRQQ